MANIRLEIDFQNQTSYTVSKESVFDYLSSILRRLDGADRLNIEVDKRPLGRKLVAIEVIITQEEEIKKLNQRFFNHAEATDVLSFPQPEASGLTGSIIICASQAAKQALQGGTNLQDEVNHLAGHGLLHLLGYHHQ